MGKKQTYKLTTASGKTIRTTANHPYLARQTKNPNLSAGATLVRSIVFVDYANVKSWCKERDVLLDLADLQKVFSLAGVAAFRFYYGTDTKQNGQSGFFEALERMGYVVITKPVQYFRVALLEILRRPVNRRWMDALPSGIRDGLLASARSLDAEGIVLHQPKANFDVEITIDALAGIDTYDTFVLFSGDGDFAPLIKKFSASGKRTIVISGRKMLSGALAESAGKFVTMERLAQIIPGLTYGIEVDRNAKPALAGQVLKNCTLSVADLLGLSSMPKTAVDNQLGGETPKLEAGEGSWRKVSELKEGMEIAIAGNVGAGEDARAVWEKVISVEPIAEEDVYDVEIEGTHNFIGNGIVAHNTAFVVNQGAPANSLYINSSGNIGIGTSTPYSRLSVWGSSASTGNAFEVVNSASTTLLSRQQRRARHQWRAHRLWRQHLQLHSDHHLRRPHLL